MFPAKMQAIKIYQKQSDNAKIKYSHNEIAEQIQVGPHSEIDAGTAIVKMPIWEGVSKQLWKQLNYDSRIHVTNDTNAS